ncbi:MULTISPECIES: sugar MFS transporter [unclassified Paenibacillus]|uniref:MFS transporter n=1 Tax=unclassified Paenibacillus TaxID=185978 RepID=UPI00114271F4|nr:MFS transporter [Paenibacillus sp. tmac-D7]
MRTFFWTGCISYLLIGLAHVIIGALMPELLAHYRKDYSAGGQLVALQFFGFLIGVLAGPWFSQKLGKRGALLVSLFCMALGEMVFFTLPPWGIVLAIAPLAGFGFGMVETIIGAVVIGHFEESRKTVAMARIEVFFGVGALVMPLLVSLFIAAGWWRGSFLALSLLSLLVFVLWAVLPLGRMSAVMAKSASNAVQAGAVPSFKGLPGGLIGLLTLFIVIFALYVGAEMSVANFLPSIMIENVGVKPEIGALSVTCFWGAMAVGRLFAAQLAGRWGKARYLLVSCASGAAVLSLFAMADTVFSSYALVLLLGLLMSGMFAVALVYANGFFPGMEERITSILIASGGVGGALIPLLTGWCMDQLSVSVALWVLVTLYVLLLALVYGASRMRFRAKAANVSSPRV